MTKADIDDSAGIGLTNKQVVACDALARGATVGEAAEAAGVSRQTCSEWSNHHSAFQAALNAKREALWGEIIGRVRSLLPRAVEVLECELESGERKVQVALAVLRLAGIPSLAPPTPAGPCGPLGHVIDFQKLYEERGSLD
jgi:transposase-like protein